MAARRKPPTNAPETKDPEHPPAEQTPAELTHAVKTLSYAIWFQAVQDRFGTPTAAAIAILAMVKFMGSETTQNDFVRAVLFAERGWALPAVALLVLFDFFVGRNLRQKYFSQESDEMKRIAAQKAELQQRLLGDRKLGHSLNFGGNPAGDSR